MYVSFFPSLILSLSLLSFGVLLNPIINTDRSVNAHSLQTLVADLIKPNMSDEEKLIALIETLNILSDESAVAAVAEADADMAAGRLKRA